MKTKQLTVPISAYLQYTFTFAFQVLFFLLVGSTGILAWIGPIGFFGVFGILEMFMPWKGTNLSKEMEEVYEKDKVFDYMIYLGFLFIWINLIYLLYIINLQWDTITGWDVAGKCLGYVVAVGPFLISNGHEMGHRKGLLADIFSTGALLVMHCLHFRHEHNVTHHKHVGTPLDPATARKGGECLWLFITLYVPRTG